MSLPRAPATLPDDFAAALGHAVAAFGFLEEALKRGIYALSRDNLGDDPSEAELDAWVTRMGQIAGDSLGTLIDAFLAACERGDALPFARRKEFAAALRGVRDRRNMLCHASWRPVEGGGWRPGFVSSRGAEVPERMLAPDLEAIRDAALAVAREVVVIARGTGHDRWTPDVEASQREQERARATARAARAAAQARPARRRPERADDRAEEDGAEEDWAEEDWAEDGAWHPLDEKDPPDGRARRSNGRRRPRRDPEGEA